MSSITDPYQTVTNINQHQSISMEINQRINYVFKHEPISTMIISMAVPPSFPSPFWWPFQPTEAPRHWAIWRSPAPPGCPVQAMVNHGELSDDSWVNMGDGWLWSIMVDHGWLWLIMVDNISGKLRWFMMFNFGESSAKVMGQQSMIHRSRFCWENDGSGGSWLSIAN